MGGAVSPEFVLETTGVGGDEVVEGIGGPSLENGAGSRMVDRRREGSGTLETGAAKLSVCDVAGSSSIGGSYVSPLS